MQGKSFPILLLANGALSIPQLHQAVFCLSKHHPLDFSFHSNPQGPRSEALTNVLNDLLRSGYCSMVERAGSPPVRLCLIEPKGEFEADLIRAQLPWNLTDYCFKLVRWIRVTEAELVTAAVNKLADQQGLLLHSEKVWSTEQ